MTETILLSVPSGARGAGVASLVLGGLGSRLDLPVDRIDELTLAADLLGADAAGESLELAMTVHDDRLVVQIGPLAAGAILDEGRRRVVEPLVDRLGVARRGGDEFAELELTRGARG